MQLTTVQRADAAVFASSWDRPVTDAELDKFYGVEVLETEWDTAKVRAAAGFDSDDLAECSSEYGAAILQALQRGDVHKVGRIFAQYRETTIQRRAEVECFGRATTQHVEGV